MSLVPLIISVAGRDRNLYDCRGTSGDPRTIRKEGIPTVQIRGSPIVANNRWEWFCGFSRILGMLKS